MAGGPGVSKTTILAHCAAKWSTGELDGDYLGTPLNVAYLTREDSASKTLVPKLMAANAGPNVVLIDGPTLDHFNLAGQRRAARRSRTDRPLQLQIIVL